MAKKETTRKTSRKNRNATRTVNKPKKIETLNINNEQQNQEIKDEIENINEQEPTNVVEQVPIIEEFEAESVVVETSEDASLGEEIKDNVLDEVASEMLAEKGNSINEFIKMPKNEMIQKAKEKIQNIKNKNNEKINEKIDNLFGYLWNGQEIEY